MVFFNEISRTMDRVNIVKNVKQTCRAGRN